MYSKENERKEGMRMKKISILFLLVLLMHINVAMAEAQNNIVTSPNKTFVVGIIHDPPFTMKNDEGKWSGINVELWSQIARSLKLDYTFKEMSFNELLQDLGHGKIDVSVAALFITAEREQLFDFTMPFGNTRLAVATLPEAMDHPWWAAIKIFFSWGILKIILLFFLILFVIGFVFWLIERESNPDHFGGGLLKGISAGIYWVGATMASGTCFGVSLHSIPGRIMGLLWMLICAVALSAFTAALASSLTAHHFMTRTINTEALRHMRIGTVKGSVQAQLLQQMGGNYTLFAEEEDVLKALMDKEIDGFLYDEVSLHYYGEHQYRRKISIYSTKLKRLPFAFGLSKNSSLRKSINVSLLNIMNEPGWEFLLARYGLNENFEVKLVRIKSERKGRAFEFIEE